jgi:anti-anti-sigma factor
MKVNVVRVGMVSVLAPEGRLDLAGADVLDKAIDEELERSVCQIVIDLKGTEFVSSAGLRVLLKIAKRFLNGSGELRIVRARPAVHEVFCVASLDTLFTFFMSCDQALQNWNCDKAKSKGSATGSPPQQG